MLDESANGLSILTVSFGLGLKEGLLVRGHDCFQEICLGSPVLGLLCIFLTELDPNFFRSHKVIASFLPNTIIPWRVKPEPADFSRLKTSPCAFTLLTNARCKSSSTFLEHGQSTRLNFLRCESEYLSEASNEVGGSTWRAIGGML